MLGLNREGDWSKGTPITEPHNFGNLVDWEPEPFYFGN
jgi:hypothetical protein